jgi:predicted ATP-grasp superfamily ATP-dependent carboligase
MDVFVYEYTCAADPGTCPALGTEGWAMLAALLEDFARVPGVRAVTLLHDRCPHEPAGARVRRARTAEEPHAFGELAAAAAATVVIAPEFDDLLVTRCRWVEEAGGRLLGPSAAAAALAGDKFLLARHLQARGVPTPGCVLLPCGGAVSEAPPLTFPVVFKPRHGAGSQATFLLRTADELPGCAARVRDEGWRGEVILQPFVPGLAASVALLLGPRQLIVLPPAAQVLSEDGRFRYLGGRLPLPPSLARRAVELAQRAVAAVPGLRGYVGVDVVLGEGGDWVIEINPRLTTSYVGLRALAEGNLAEALSRVADGEEVARLRWRRTPVRFDADGQVFSARAQSGWVWRVRS